jgi:hypothetical protein
VQVSFYARGLVKINVKAQNERARTYADIQARGERPGNGRKMRIKVNDNLDLRMIRTL